MIIHTKTIYIIINTPNIINYKILLIKLSFNLKIYIFTN
jgi:hypothetical protein